MNSQVGREIHIVKIVLLILFLSWIKLEISIGIWKFQNGKSKYTKRWDRWFDTDVKWSHGKIRIRIRTINFSVSYKRWNNWKIYKGKQIYGSVSKNLLRFNANNPMESLPLEMFSLHSFMFGLFLSVDVTKTGRNGTHRCCDKKHKCVSVECITKFIFGASGI